jgi:MFS family permease
VTDKAVSPVRLVAVLLGAELLTMLGVFTFPALLPDFFDIWDLTSTGAGWINGIYFAGYVAGVPLAVGLTDRVDARRIYLAGALITAIAAAGFALLADGFWTAMVFRALAGAGLACTYMPGLRIIVDRYDGPHQGRAVSFYTAGFSLGTALSFLAAGGLAEVLGWRWAFAAAFIAAIAGLALVAGLVAPKTPARPDDDGFFLDFRPVLANRAAMGFIVAYGIHGWELFALRSWLVAFLAFSLTLQPIGAGWLTPTVVATLSALVAVGASIGGQELAARLGLRRVIVATMMLSAAMAFTIGFAPAIPYTALVVLVLIYTVAVQADSAVLTIGAVRSAGEGRRGATLAVHSLAGFGGAAMGPLVLGIVLDLGGGMADIGAWGLAFASVGVIGLLGPVAILVLRGRAGGD